MWGYLAGYDSILQSCACWFSRLNSRYLQEPARSWAFTSLQLSNSAIELNFTLCSRTLGQVYWHMDRETQLHFCTHNAVYETIICNLYLFLFFLQQGLYMYVRIHKITTQCQYMYKYGFYGHNNNNLLLLRALSSSGSPHNRPCMTLVNYYFCILS